MLELKGIRLHDRQEMYTKRIANIEKLFNKKQSAIESKYSRLQSGLTSQISMLSATDASMGGAVGAINTIFAPFGLNAVNSTVIKGLTDAAGVDVSKLGQGIDTSKQELEQERQRAQQRATLASQLQATLQTVLEALKEADLAQLEALEDRQREPIAEKDAEIQADVAENDTLMELAKERMEAAKGRLPDTVKGSVAHYGLS